MGEQDFEDDEEITSEMISSQNRSEEDYTFEIPRPAEQEQPFINL